MVRIALLTDGIHPHVLGGMQMHSFYLAIYFARNKIHVDLYHPVTEMEEKAFISCFSAEEIKYIHPVFVASPKTIYFPGHYIYESFAYSKNIYFKYLQHKMPDFIYVQGFAGWELIRQKKRGNSSIPPIGVNFHGLNMFQSAFDLKNFLNNFLFRPAVRFNLKYADCVFSLAPKLSELISDIVDGKDIINIPVGIENSWIVKENEIKNNEVLSFVFVGRFDRVKGIRLLNKAIKNLLKKDDKFIFNFIGPFPENARLNHSNVLYKGEIKDVVMLKSMIRQNDVIICSSYSEGMPTVIIEAMASGLAVISTNVGAVGELVNEENGCLISPGNVEAIEKSMTAFIQMNKKQLLKMKKQSVIKVNDHFLWDKVIAQILSEIEMRIHKKM